MQTLVCVMMFSVVLACALRLSMWKWWQALAYCAVLAGVIVFSERYAILQSKTQLQDFLVDTAALQDMAIVVTLDSAFGFAFVACHLNAGDGGPKRWWERLVYWFPPLLVVPVSFYALTQATFLLVGVDFGLTAIGVAAGFLVALMALAQGARAMLPERDARAEMLLFVTCIVCVLGLLSTQSGRMVYAARENPVDLGTALLALGAFVAMFFLGIVLSRLRWGVSNRKQKANKQR